MSDINQDSGLLGAIDLGSNSFHLIQARVVDGQIQIVDRLKEMVRLAEGLDSDNYLQQDVFDRALSCLEKFGQRLRNLPSDRLRIVGTNTLRMATNSQEFLSKAEAALNHPIQIISGVEEARLIYLGVSHSIANTFGRRLVIDIGGGSTELIIGKGFESVRRESIPVGCVSMTKQFFTKKRVTEQDWEDAITHIKLELRPWVNDYKSIGWQNVIGASGTFNSVNQVMIRNGFSQEGITATGLAKLLEQIKAFNHRDEVNLAGLSEQRKPVIFGGAAVVQALFESFDIQAMQVSSGALREGVIYDLAGRLFHQDTRQLTIAAFAKRYVIDEAHSHRVIGMIKHLIDISNRPLLSDDEFALLTWAAHLHEIGLSIEHGSYHKHSAYIVMHADMPGFSRQEQTAMAWLVGNQRRKLSKSILSSGAAVIAENQLVQLVLLRLSLLLKRGRLDPKLPLVALQIELPSIHLEFANGWMDKNPLTQADLEQEQKWLISLEVSLSFV